MHEMFTCIRKLFTHKLNLAKFYNVECEIASMTPLWAVLWFFCVTLCFWIAVKKSVWKNCGSCPYSWSWACWGLGVGMQPLWSEVKVRSVCSGNWHATKEKSFLEIWITRTSTEIWWQITVDWGLFIHSFYQDFLNSASPENAKMIKTKSLPTRCQWTQVELETYSLEVKHFFLISNFYEGRE